jgi:hypothetical protein
MLVPAATVPDPRAGLGVLDAAFPDAVLGRDGTGVGLVAVGLLLGFSAGTGARPATSGASAVEGAGGMTSTDATESCMAADGDAAIAVAGGMSAALFLSPQALRRSRAAAVSGRVSRGISSIDRMCVLLVQMVAR